VIRLAHALVVASFHALLFAAPAPEWAVHAVWYQIFPERFHNGDPANDPTRASLEQPIAPSEKWRITPWEGDWFSRDEWERELGPNFYWHVNERRYGGDLQGIIEKLEYLADLGINALYLNPIFHARSLHKYDGDTLHHVDPYFGPDPAGDLALMREETADPKTWRWTAADKLFVELVKAAHARGIRVVLDGVFNHTGRDFFAFRDVREKQAASPFRDWYAVERFDDPAIEGDEFKYRGWGGSDRLPEFAKTASGDDLHAGPKAYIFDASRRWMEVGIDGWRLDAADQLPPKFWIDWHAHLRAINPGVFTSAEVWKDTARLVHDGHFSAAMNYEGFAYPVKGFLVDGRISASRFARMVVAPPAMQNVIDSHDTARLASMIVNRATARYDDAGNIPFNTDNSAEKNREYQTRAPDERERRIQRLVVLFQMTAPGAPMIYYGDEAGMWGARDPDSRMPMRWKDADADLRAFYKAAIALRREHAALRTGAMKWTPFDDQQCVVFTRGELLVVLNRSEHPQTLRLDAGAQLFFTTYETVKREGGQILMPPLSGAVFGPR